MGLLFKFGQQAGQAVPEYLNFCMYRGITLDCGVTSDKL